MAGRQALWTCALVAACGVASRAAAQPALLADSALRAYAAEVLARNAALAAARNQVGAAEERIGPAGALPDPVLGFGLMSAPVSSFDLGREPMTQFPISLSQTLPFPGKQGAAAAAARREAEAAESRWRLDAQTTVAAAAGSFFELAYARAALDVWRERLALAEAAARVARSRYETGRAPQADALRAEVRRAALVEEEYEVAARVEAALARADAWRGGPGDSIRTPTLVPPDSGWVRAVLEERLPPLGSLSQALAARNPALAVARAEAEAAGAVARVYSVAARPDVMLEVEYAPRVGRDPFASARVGLSLPVWARRKQGPAAEAARLEWAAARRRTEDLEARIAAELRERVAELDALRRAVETLWRELVPLAEAAAESSLRSYAVGAVDLAGVLDAQDDLYRARLALARNLATYGARRADLSALLGEEWYR